MWSSGVSAECGGQPFLVALRDPWNEANAARSQSYCGSASTDFPINVLSSNVRFSLDLQNR